MKIKRIHFAALSILVVVGWKTAHANPIDLFEQTPVLSKNDTQEYEYVFEGAYNDRIARTISTSTVLSMALKGETELFNVEKVSRKSANQVSYVAKNNEGNSITVAEYNGRVVGSLWKEGTLYKLRPAGNGNTAIIQVDAEGLRDHGEQYQEIVSSQVSLNKGGTEIALDASVLVDTADEFTVIVAYTSGFASDAGDVQAFMDLIEMETNDSFSNSGVTTRVNIVHHYQTNYSDTGDFYTDRSYFGNSSNTHTAQLHQLRDQYSADIMIILTGNSGYTFCGVASGIGVSEQNAYALARESCAAGYYSFGHEIGHLFGARHIITQDSSSTPFAYGHGYCNTTASTWRTVMAYNCPSNTGGPRIQQWSNPDVSLSGDPTGTASLENNARVLNERALTVANFRAADASPSLSEPSPENASTVVASSSGQLLRIRATGVQSAVFHYDDDSNISHQISGSVVGEYVQATIPYEDGKMSSDGTNYWYVEATNTSGTTRYPTSGQLSFVVTPPPPVPVISNPDPSDGATVVAGSSGQLLRVHAPGATSGRIYYDDDSNVSFDRAAIVNGDFLEVTIPYSIGVMSNTGTNYWYVEATNAAGTARYPTSGNLTFTVEAPATGPTVSNPSPTNDAIVNESVGGQLLRVKAVGATSGTIHYDDDAVVSFQVAATVNGDYLETVVPYTAGSMANNGTNYWFVSANDSEGTTRYPASGNLSFRVNPIPSGPAVSEPLPNHGDTVVEGASGQFLRVKAEGATGGTIYYDDDSAVSFQTPATVNGDYLEATIAYQDGRMKNDGTNYWYVVATNSLGSTRYPASGNLSFDVTVAPDSFEPDNSSAAASPIGSRANQTHNIVPIGDEDWVTFSIDAPTNVTIETSGLSGDTRLWLYDSDLTEVAFDDNGGDGLFSRIQINDLVAGVYYIAVDENGSNETISSYTLRAVYSSPDSDDDFLLQLVPAIISAIKKNKANAVD